MNQKSAKMSDKTVFHWNKPKAYIKAIFTKDDDDTLKFILWCILAIIPLSAIVFLLLIVLGNLFGGAVAFIILAIGVILILADIGYAVFLLYQYLHEINEYRCISAKITFSNDICVLYEKHKHYIKDQTFNVANIERVDYYKEADQLVLFVPTSHYYHKSFKKKNRQAYLDTEWCFIENHFKEDLLGYLKSLDIEINYIEKGYFVQTRKEVYNKLQAIRQELIDSHEYLFVENSIKHNQMMNQSIASRGFRLYVIILFVFAIISLFIMPIVSAIFIVAIVFVAIVKLFSRKKDANARYTTLNPTVTINTYSDTLIYRYTYANQEKLVSQSLTLSKIKKIDYYPKSRKILIYAKEVQNASITSNCMLIDDIFDPDLVDFLNKNIMPVNYKRGIYRWGLM